MGTTWSQFFPPKPTFSVNDIPDLTGQVMVVTGGNSGIGKEIIRSLLEHNAVVYLAARNPESAKSAIADLKALTGKEAQFLEIDLANLPSIKRAAAEFLSKESQLHVLFNNGGVMRPPIEQLTKQGYDLQFGTNVLGHFYLTQLLLPTLLSTASTSGKPTRIIHTSSLSTHMFNGTSIDFNTVKESPKRVTLGTAWLYHQSKFGNAVLSAELHRRYAEQGIVSVALNPGNIMTDLGRHMPPFALYILKFIVYPAPFGALTSLYAGTTKEGELLGGKYLFPWARLGDAPPAVNLPENGKELWTWCEEQVAET
ncbi:NAD-P-binding protein [Mycena amicta]|nr:NAD-P-binding protein [Mycena amicta]